MPILLSSFYFFYFAIIGVYVIFMPKVLVLSGYSASEIGIIFAISPLVRFILPFAFTKGLKIDKKLFNLALLVMLFSSLSFYYSLSSFYKLIFSNIGLGIGLSIVLPYIEVISLSLIGKERYGKIRLFGSLGFVLVALLLVRFLSDSFIALNYLLITTFFTTLVAYFIAKNPHAKREQKEYSQNDIDLFRDWRLWLGLTLMQVSFGSFYNFFTIYETDFGISLDTTINLWVFGVVAEILMLFFQGRFLRNNLLSILQLTTFITSFRWLLLYFFPQNLLLVFFTQSLHALSFALFHSAAISYLFFRYKHKALAQQFFSGITYGLGGFLGALLAGYIYEWFSNELFLSSSFIAMLACGFLYLESKRFN
jgi:PPP family 3-phenylpropionic acid transporter